MHNVNKGRRCAKVMRNHEVVIDYIKREPPVQGKGTLPSKLEGFLLF